MFKNFVQKWNAFRSDLDEYKELCRAENVAAEEVMRRRSGVSSSCPGPSPVCIFINQDARARVADVNVCKDFTGALNEHPTAACVRKSCECYSNNCKYVAAVQKYQELSERRRMFWKDVKHRTK